MIKPIVIAATLVLSLLTAATAVAQVEYGRRADDRRYDNDDRHDDDDNDHRYGNNREQVRCESRGQNYTRCKVAWHDARLVRQTTNNECRKGRSWGLDLRGLWVDRGCGGVFEEVGGHDQGDAGDHGNAGGPWRPGNDWDRDIRFTCQSQDYGYKMCQVDTGRGSEVRIERQISNTRCIQNRNWGYNRAGVWVNGGCAAIFSVERRWR